MFGITTGRATLDIDFGIQVRRWEEFQRVIDGMLSLGKYTRDTTKVHRLHSSSIIDIVPFDGIEQPAGSIVWPPANDIMMRTIGFLEAMRFSVDVCVARDPELIVKVCTPPGLMLMKLNAWKDGDQDRKVKDAVDIHFLLQEYINAGNEMRLYGTDQDLLTDQLDYDHSSARMLGRDVGKICSPETRSILNSILERETNDDSQYHLVGDMMTSGIIDEYTPLTALELLKQFYIGMNEHTAKGNEQL